MIYKIGEVARLLGMTAEGIRYYEDSGIITPQKGNSNVRYYNVWDIHMLIRARSYRRIGFSLSQISDLINSHEKFDLDATLTKSENDIEAEIIHKFNMLQYIRQIKNMVITAPKMVGKYRLEYSPAIYRIEVQEEHDLNTSQPYETFIREWIAKVPFVFSSALISKSDLEEECNHYTIGFAIESEYSDYLKITENNYVRYFPEKLCINTTIPSNSGEQFSINKLKDAIRYIRSQGLSLAGDVFSRIVMIHKDGEVYVNLHQFWFPVK